MSVADGILGCMQRIDGHLVLSPTDLTKHVACPHITTLDLEALDSTREMRASGPDDTLNLVFAMGLTHERDYLESLIARGLVIEDIAALGLGTQAAEEATRDAMRRGVDVIYQATFFDGHWVGFADFLLKTDRPSELGGWSYDIADTKLARRLKVPALLQMATYAARLATLQGVEPQYLVVVTGDKHQHPWRLIDVAPYARRRRADLEDAIADPRRTESARVQHCSQCRWKDRCAQEWRDRDDLIQVAGMRADHRTALRAVGITTMEALADAPEQALVGVLSQTTRERLHQQARLQVQERRTDKPAHELLPPQPRRGLQALPEPDEGDVYLDFEGDPWAEGGAGREYLAGICDRSGQFTGFWAHDFEQEGRLTADLVDWLVERWRRYPQMHVYHYAPYETTALKRLVGQHATREAELDQLLRHEVFVDLYAVTRQSVRISKGSYSIKKLEEFYWGHVRSAEGDEVADGLSSVVEYERYLAGRDEGRPDQSILDAIRDYNEQDVLSTLALHDWLEERRTELEARDGLTLARRTPAEAKEISDEERAEIDLADRLVEAGHELLAGCVGWHRREQRPEWWDFFRYEDLEPAALVEDATAIGAPRDPVQVDTIRRSKVWRYSFDPQDCKPPVSRGRAKAYVKDVDPPRAALGWVRGFSAAEGWVDIVMGATKEPIVPRGIAGPGPLGDKELRGSIARTGELVLSGGGNLATRLLDRSLPTPDVLQPRDGETAKDVVVRVGLGLSGQVLAVQGPPGTGKTFAGGHLVRALLDAGLRVGVTALSHAVIRNLLAEVDRPALHKVSERDPDALVADPEVAEPAARAGRSITEVTDIDEVAQALTVGEANLVGGTAWLWSREQFADAVDVLVIDEAGQFSLANAVAVAPAATSLVLLGDPQQLTQPTKATHPFGSGVSALDHLLDGHDTIPASRGVFLGTTYRMQPSLTRFVSDLAYEGRLASADGRELVTVEAPGALSGDGLRWRPVEHTTPSEQTSHDEVSVVVELVTDLLRGEWTDAEGATAPLTAAEILVVAPYNAHVAALQAALPPGIRAGTVDTFQGQQAAVVIYSMGSTSAAHAPRGVGFLYDVHRLNVAVSRAKALAVIVASPVLLDAAVHSPEDLRAVNALCRFVEEAKLV